MKNWSDLKGRTFDLLAIFCFFMALIGAVMVFGGITLPVVVKGIVIVGIISAIYILIAWAYTRTAETTSEQEEADNLTEKEE